MKKFKCGNVNVLPNCPSRVNGSDECNLVTGECHLKVETTYYSKVQVINALHKVELKHNKDYSILWSEMYRILEEN